MEKKVESKRVQATLELLELAEENPGLPIIAEVNSEVIGNESYMSLFGEVTGACIEGVLSSKVDGKCRTWTLSEALISSYVFVEENAPEPLKQKFKKLFAADINDFIKESYKWIKSLPWKKCIIVCVDVPYHIVPELEI